MIVLIMINLFLQWAGSNAVTINDISSIRYNSLISAQCKARCLYEYRHHHHQQRSLSVIHNNGKTKRLLTTNGLSLPWQSIWKRCPRLVTCSSCILPCDLDPPLLLSNEQSCQAICSTLRSVECQRSCIFIQNLYQQQANCLTDDCQSSSCSLTNDCFEKLPQTKNVTAIERQSRRTVKLKWDSNEATNAEPVFYVIEAQWTLPKTDLNQEDTISKWGFVKEEVSHTKAIIRNIQRDNRWYSFRIAAVTRHGYSPFSMTAKPFRLSSKNESQKSRTVIAPPKDFIVKDFQANSNIINVTVGWQKPDSSHSGYQISWEAQNDPSSLVNTIDISSSLNPLELTIPFLSIHTSYIFKIHSLFIPDDDQMQMSVPVSIRFNYEEEMFAIKDLQISEPYFINGLIKTNISWNKINDHRIEQYDIHWIETKCSPDILPCCYRRDAFTKENFFQLYDLRFNCTYVLHVNPVIAKRRLKKSFQAHFNISSCQLIKVHGSIRPPCQTDNFQTTSSLSILKLLGTKNESGIQLSWQNVHSFLYDDTNIVYQLRIEQLPSQIELISVDLSPTITNYFFPYSKQQSDPYLNATLIVSNHGVIREKESIIIDGSNINFNMKYFQSNRNAQLSINSSAAEIRVKYFHLLTLFMFVDLIRR